MPFVSFDSWHGIDDFPIQHPRVYSLVTTMLKSKGNYSKYTIRKKYDGSIVVDTIITMVPI